MWWELHLELRDRVSLRAATEIQNAECECRMKKAPLVFSILHSHSAFRVSVAECAYRMGDASLTQRAPAMRGGARCAPLPIGHYGRRRPRPLGGNDEVGDDDGDVRAGGRDPGRGPGPGRRAPRDAAGAAGRRALACVLSAAARRSAFAFERARSSAFFARIAAMRSWIGISSRSAGRCA